MEAPSAAIKFEQTEGASSHGAEIERLGYAPDTRRWMISSRLARRTLVFLLTFFVLYVGSYAVLSRRGRYEPIRINPWSVKDYVWAPAGMVSSYRWRWTVAWTYMPLWLLDRAYWHGDNGAYAGRYPVHKPKSMGEVYAAWDRKK